MATTDEAAPSAGPPDAAPVAWHALEPGAVDGAPRCLGRAAGLSGAEAASRLASASGRTSSPGRGRAALAGVRAPVPRPDADRAARRRASGASTRERARHRPRADLPDALQRGARPAPGGQGGGGGRGAAEDDDRQGARPARRRARAASGRGARARRRRLDRGRRRRARRRAAALGGDARGRRVGADRREPARLEGRGGGRIAGHAARRPDGHGLHEHERDARRGQLRRHRRPGWRPRSATSRTCSRARGRGRHAADDPAQEADEPDPRRSRGRRRDLDRPQPLARRELRHRLHRGDRVRDLRDPDRAARRSSRRSSRTGRSCSRRRTRS